MAVDVSTQIEIEWTGHYDEVASGCCAQAAQGNAEGREQISREYTTQVAQQVQVPSDDR